MLPLLLLPGMLCDARLFGHQIAELAPEATVAVGDLTQDDSIIAMAQRALADAPGERFILAGLSLGGIVAMEMARLAPERISRLVLMATNHRGPSQSFIDMRTEQITRAHAGGFRDIVIDEMKVNYFSQRAAGDAALRTLVVDMAMTAGPVVFERQARALIGRRDQADTLAALTCPTRLVAGGEDQLCPVETHRAMARLIPHARLEIVPEAGHLLSLETPAAITDLFRRELAQL